MVPYRVLIQALEAVGKQDELRLSPPGVIEQQERRSRFIVDYTFYGVNPETLKLAPEEAMQFGRALEHTMYLIWHANPVFGPHQKSAQFQVSPARHYIHLYLWIIFTIF